MKELVRRSGLVLGVLFLSLSAMATVVDPPTVEKVESDLNMSISTGDVCRVVIAECCESFIDFTSKKSNAIKVLRSGCDEDCIISEAGDYKFFDYINKEDKKVARLVVNENEKILMLITYEFKKYN